MRMPAIATCATATLLAATPALANDVVVQEGRWDDRPYLEVHYNDLDLDSQDGIDTLNRRLVSAVKTVCGEIDVRRLKEHAAIRGCRNDSMERAFADRDAVLAMRMAAREDPTRLAAMEMPALRVGR